MKALSTLTYRSDCEQVRLSRYDLVVCVVEKRKVRLLICKSRDWHVIAHGLKAVQLAISWSAIRLVGPCLPNREFYRKTR